MGLSQHFDALANMYVNCFQFVLVAEVQFMFPPFFHEPDVQNPETMGAALLGPTHGPELGTMRPWT